MRVLIFGSGSIGSFFGAKLALNQKNKVYVYAGNKLSNYLNKNKLKITTNGKKNLNVENLWLAPEPEKFSKGLFPEICIISSKTYDLETICEQYESILTRIPVIILLQNGIGNEEIIQKQQKLRNKTIYRLITSHGAYMSEIGHVIHKGVGTTTLCKIISRESKDSDKNLRLAERFKKILNEADIETDISSNSQEDLWKKAFINIGINAFASLTGLRNGQLLEIKSLTTMIKKTVEEAYSVAKRLDISLNNKNSYIKAVFDVINATYDNKNSMLQDILRGKPTEIDFLNGKIVEYGNQLNIPTPLNSLLTSLIHGLEKRKL